MLSLVNSSSEMCIFEGNNMETIMYEISVGTVHHSVTVHHVCIYARHCKYGY